MLERPLRNLWADRPTPAPAAVRSIRERRLVARTFIPWSGAGLGMMAVVCGALMLVLGVWMVAEDFLQEGLMLAIPGAALLALYIPISRSVRREVDRVLRVHSHGERRHGVVDEITLHTLENGRYLSLKGSVVVRGGVQREFVATEPASMIDVRRVGDKIAVYVDDANPKLTLPESSFGRRA